MVGSFAWAHPASEWCAIGVALDADVELHGLDGVREVAARDYFHGPYRTARRQEELITSVRYPLLGEDTGGGFVEHRRTHFCFAQVAVAAALTVRDGLVHEARIGLVNCADRPVRARAAEQVRGRRTELHARRPKAAAREVLRPDTAVHLSVWAGRVTPGGSGHLWGR